MNVPGVADGNWRWRFTADQFSNGAIERLAEWTERYNRMPPTH
jgi:4-alpha-glucanotransferase